MRVMNRCGMTVLLGLCCTCVLGASACGGEAAWELCKKRAGEHKFNNDYDAARTALKTFLAAHPGSANASEARKELESLESVAEKQIQGIYSRARKYSDRRMFDPALELFTEVITRAPSAGWVKKAREGIERNDQATEPLFNAVGKRYRKLFAEWKFSEAAETVKKTAADLIGTKWSDKAGRTMIEAQALSAFFKRLGAKVEKGKRSPKRTPFKIRDLSGWKVSGKISKIDEQGMMCLVTGAGKSYTWKSFLPKSPTQEPKRFLEIMDLYSPTAVDQLALGILLYRHGFKKAAASRFKLAAGDAKLADETGYYLDLISGTLNRVAYDFSSGLQLMDWQARGGRWRIVKGRLVQEAERGEAELILSRRKYQAKAVRLFFEMSTKSKRGLISVVLVQDEKNSFGFTFSPAQGYSAFASVDGKVKTVKLEKFRLPWGRKVRIRCGLKGNTFALSVGRTKMPRLTAAGLTKLQGTFRLRTLEAKAQFDNIVIRNVKD
jgi:hypothetical protein